jgi:acyl-CoA reductase-like NAD-dependent aldehyde dehydrogenase
VFNVVQGYGARRGHVPWHIPASVAFPSLLGSDRQDHIARAGGGGESHPAVSELGGKSSVHRARRCRHRFLAAIPRGAAQYDNAGQVCLAPVRARLLVHESIVADSLPAFTRGKVESSQGDPRDPLS